MLKNRRKANGSKRKKIQKESQKGIIEDSHITNNTYSWLHPHCNYV